MHPLNPPKSVPGSLPGPSWPFVGPGRSGTQRGLAHLGRPKAPKNDPKYFKSASGRRNKPAKSENMIFRSPFLQIEFFCILFRFKNHQFFNNLLLRSSIQIHIKIHAFFKLLSVFCSSKAKKSNFVKIELPCRREHDF